MPKFLSVYEERAASTRFCERATLFRETAVWRCFINMCSLNFAKFTRKHLCQSLFKIFQFEGLLKMIFNFRNQYSITSRPSIPTRNKVG